MTQRLSYSIKPPKRRQSGPLSRCGGAAEGEVMSPVECLLLTFRANAVDTVCQQQQLCCVSASFRPRVSVCESLQLEKEETLAPADWFHRTENDKKNTLLDPSGCSVS